MAKASDDVKASWGEAAYVRLAVRIALDERLDADSLGLLAYRATFGGEYALNRKRVSRVLAVGDAVFDRAITQLQACGYISRRRAGDTGCQHARTIETLFLPTLGVGGRYVFIRRGEIERLGVKLTGVYLFVAARPPAHHVYLREVAARFGKVEQTASKWLARLARLGWIEREQYRADNGGFNGVGYFASASRPRSRHAQLTPSGTLSPGVDGSFGALNWIDDIPGEGSRIDMWRQGLQDNERLEWCLEEVSDAAIKDALLQATSGRLHPDLLSAGGLQSLRMLMAAVIFVVDASPSAALDFISEAVRQKFQDPNRWLNSWAYVGKILFGLFDDESNILYRESSSPNDIPF